MGKILLNGVGRIGKAILQIFLKHSNYSIVAINEKISNIDNIAYSINYDSTYGKLEDKFKVCDNSIENSCCKIDIFNYSSLENFDFKKYNIDYIIDASGSKIEIESFKKLSVKNIFLTHPNKEADINLILGVNEQKVDLKKDKIISTSSCNATALLPLLKIIDENYGISCGDIATIHPFLNHQKVLDSGCVASFDRDIECNFEFGRSSTQNIIPSGTTTVTACSYVMDKISSDILTSNSFRVPTVTVGAINVTLFTQKSVDNTKLKNILDNIQSNQKFKVIRNSYEPLVSSDFSKCEYTTIIDHRFTDIKNGKMVKFVLWYDNEWGYASKVVDIVNLIKRKNCENNSK